MQKCTRVFKLLFKTLLCKKVRSCMFEERNGEKIKSGDAEREKKVKGEQKVWTEVNMIKGQRWKEEKKKAKATMEQPEMTVIKR